MKEISNFTFDSLVSSIRHLHYGTVQSASRAVNIGLTIRNWGIGFFISEFEQQGKERAAYGENLLEQLAKKLQQQGLKRLDVRELRRFRQFYTIYPHIRETVTPELLHLLPAAAKTAIISMGKAGQGIRGTLSP